MERTHVIPDHRIRLTDTSIAKLLGIPIEDYHSLSHLPLEPETDIDGKIVKFRMHISTNNNPNLLSKINRDKNNVVKFKAEDVFKLYSW